MATTVDTLVVRIEADMKDMRRALRRVEGDVSKSTTKMSGAFKKLGGVMKLALAAVAVRQAFQAGKAMINLASDIEEMQGKSKVVFGAFRANVVQELAEFGDAVGRSTHELEGMASTVQDTFVPMGFARGEAAKLSVEMTKLAVDVASFNNASDTDTMNAFQSALVGNHETVRRFGVVITEATLDQELMTMGIQAGAKAATNAQKVQARLNLITKGVKDAQGDAARTAESYANQMKGLRAEFSELVGALGKRFLPMLVSVIGTLRTVTQKVKDFLQAMNIIDTPFSDAMRKAKQRIVDVQIEMRELQKLINTKKPGAEKSLYDTFFYTDQVRKFKGELIALDEFIRRQATQTQITMPPPREDKSTDGDSEASFTSGSLFGDADKFISEMEAIEAQQEAVKKLSRLHFRLHEAQTGGQPNLADELKREIHFEEMRGQFTQLSEEKIRELSDAQWYSTYATQAYSSALSKLQNEKENDIVLGEKGLALYKNETDATILLREQTEQLQAAMRTGAIDFAQYQEAMARITEVIPPVNEAFEQMKDRVQTTFDAMSDSLTQMVMDGKINFGTMKDMFKDMVRQMIADALKAQVIKPILGSIFGSIGGAVGGNIGAAFSAVGATAKAAGGGSLQRGNPYLVGERGPELIVPSSAGTIMNNHNTKNAMGGGGGTVVNQTINVQSGVAQTVRAEMISLLPRFKQDTMNAVVDAKRRGGAFGQAFG